LVSTTVETKSARLCLATTAAVVPEYHRCTSTPNKSYP